MNSELLRQARRRSGLTQGDVAKKLGSSVITYRKKESGTLRFYVEDVSILIQLYDLSRAEVSQIFFDGKLSKLRGDVSRPEMCMGCVYRSIARQMLDRTEKEINRREERLEDDGCNFREIGKSESDV